MNETLRPTSFGAILEFSSSTNTWEVQHYAHSPALDLTEQPGLTVGAANMGRFHVCDGRLGFNSGVGFFLPGKFI